MAASPANLALGLATIAGLWGLILLAWRHELGKARRAAEALGLAEDPGSTGWSPRFHGWLEARPLSLRTSNRFRERWLLLEAEAPVPPGFTLVLGDDAPARAAGVPVRGLAEVATGWPHFDGWAWPRASEAALARAFLLRCRRALNAAPPAALWCHGGRIGIAARLASFDPRDAPGLARALGRRLADLEEVLARPALQRAAFAPLATPEEFGPGDDEAPEVPVGGASVPPEPPARRT